MAAPVIQASPELMRSKANDVRSYKAQHDEAMSKLRTLVYALGEIWKGDGQVAFVNTYEGMQSTFNAFSAALEKYAKDIEGAAHDFENADATGKARIGG